MTNNSNDLMRKQSRSATVSVTWEERCYRVDDTTGSEPLDKYVLPYLRLRFVNTHYVKL